MRNARRFTTQKVAHRIGEAPVGQPVRRMRRYRQQAARQLVRALGATFKVLKTIRDAPLNRLVVASLEVQ